MKAFSNTLIVVLMILLSGCSSENDVQQSSEPKTKNKLHQYGTFTVKLSNGTGFTEQAKRFRVKHASDDLWEFIASNWHIRIQAIKLEPTSPSRSTDLVYNNTFVYFYQDIDGKRTKVTCKPDRDPVGEVLRSHMDDKTVSATFEFTVVKCQDFYTAKSISNVTLPIHVKGSFDRIALIDMFNR